MIVAWLVLYLFNAETAMNLVQALAAFLSEIVNALFDLLMWVFGELNGSAFTQ